MASSPQSEGLSRKGWWHRRVVTPACRFYADPPDALNAFFWIDFVLPAGFYLLVYSTLSSVGFFVRLFLVQPSDQNRVLVVTMVVNLILKLLLFIGIQGGNLYAARHFSNYRTLFIAIFVLNFIALPTRAPAFIPALFSIVPVWSNLLHDGFFLARTGAFSPVSLLVMALTGGPVL
ncbi:hypothetical protein [uncultured Martelella sp.]|uniref:hypothetical protein n=1 Tax=uncultured Martelella sp. TaxID=392331 RepID=UPI0029C73125|nr:hypothetical protein [uncultured Martelella sp.]